MSVGTLIWLRERFHPLHWLRQSPFVAKSVLPLFDRQIFIRMHGVRWPVRVWRMRHMSYVIDNRIVEPGISALFLALQKMTQCRVFWDVGANAGFYSWLLMSEDDRLSVVLFEPDPENLSLLHATIDGAGLSARAAIVAKAASDASGEARFVIDANSSATSHLESGGHGAAGRVVTVPTTTLDAELDHRPGPDLIKIDVEGAEDIVFAGSARMLTEVRPIIMLESFGGLKGPALRRLADAGYEFLCAEDLSAPADTAENYLCLPPDCVIDRAALQRKVEAEFARWTGKVAA